MDSSKILLLTAAAFTFYSTTASWLLQFGKRWVFPTVVPMILTHLLTFACLFFHSDSVPVGLIYVAAICSAVILFSKIRNGKLNVAAWTVASAAMFFLVFKMLT